MSWGHGAWFACASFAAGVAAWFDSEHYEWALQDGYMQEKNRRRNLDVLQIHSGDGQDRSLSDFL